MLSDEDRVLLDRASAATGRSVESLIREAVRTRFGAVTAGTGDTAAVESAFGSWDAATADGEMWVDQLRSGCRLSSA